jgi:chaperonin cofactor prefoldin
LAASSALVNHQLVKLSQQLERAKAKKQALKQSVVALKKAEKRLSKAPYDNQLYFAQFFRVVSLSSQ